VEPGQVIAGKYELVRQIGAGGMGEVWAAHHRRIDRHVAIKFPDVNLVKRPEIRGRFLAEARILGRLQHPNIVDVLDFGELDDEGLFLVFELLDGTSLDAHIQEMGRLASRNAVHLGIEICRGLAFAHDAHVIHRDLKPANIFLHRAPDGRMRVKILDFGISKAIGDGDENLSLTGSGAVVGTPAYMSYEQAKALPDIDARSDVWNVGVLLYEMLSGLPPFEAKTFSSTIAKIVSEPVAPISTWGAIVPIELENIVQRCLAKERNDRFQSAHALVVALEAVMPRCSEPPASRRLQLDSLADLPTMPTPPSFIPPSAPSSSLRVYSPCALTMEGDPSSPGIEAPSVRNTLPSSKFKRASRAAGIAIGAAAMLAMGAGLATLAYDDVSVPASNGSRSGPHAGASHGIPAPSPVSSAAGSTSAASAGSAVTPAAPSDEDPSETLATEAPTKGAASKPAATSPAPPPRPPKRSAKPPPRRKPATLVDDPGF